MKTALLFKKPKCSHAYTIGNEDISIDFCEINDKICLLESGNKCEIYEEEIKDER